MGWPGRALTETTAESYENWWATETYRHLAPVVETRQGYDWNIPRGGATRQLASVSGQGDRRTLLEQLHQAYRTCPWVAAAVTIIARMITAGGLQIVTDDDTPDDASKAEPPQVVRLRKLFEFVNPRQDLVQLLRQAIIDLLVFGDAFIEVVVSIGEPVELYSLDAVSMSVTSDEHGNITGFVQDVDGIRTCDFDVDEVIHISIDNARGGLYGCGPTELAMLPITSWLYLAACIKEIGRRGDPPRIHVDLGKVASGPQGKVDKEIWWEQYQINNIGPRAIGQPILTTGGGTVTELSHNKLSEMIAARDKERDTILAVFGVPPRKVGVVEPGSLGGAGSEEGQNKTIKFDTCGPIAALLLEKLNYVIVKQGFGIVGWHVEFAEVDYRDSKVVEEIRTMRVERAGYTPNRYREEIGEPPVDGGDEAVIIQRTGVVMVADLVDYSQATIDHLRGPAATTAALDPLTGQPTVPPPGPPSPPNPDNPDSPDQPGGPGDATQGSPPREIRGPAEEAQALSSAWRRAYQANRRNTLKALPAVSEMTEVAEFSDVSEASIPGPDRIAKVLAQVKDLPDSGDAGHVEPPWPFYKDPLPDIKGEDWNRAELTKVKLSDLKAGTMRLDRRNLAWHVANPTKSKYRGQFNAHPQVAKVGKDLVIVDGHHRLAAMAMLGWKKMPVFLLDTDKSK